MKKSPQEVSDTLIQTSTSTTVPAQHGSSLHPPDESIFHKMVILNCPQCGNKTEMNYRDWCRTIVPLSHTRIRCEVPRCKKTILVYHKMKGDR